MFVAISFIVLVIHLMFDNVFPELSIPFHVPHQQIEFALFLWLSSRHVTQV